VSAVGTSRGEKRAVECLFLHLQEATFPLPSLSDFARRQRSDIHRRHIVHLLAKVPHAELLAVGEQKTFFYHRKRRDRFD
jgi:hypothetical protein